MNDVTRRTLGAGALLGAASLAACSTTNPAFADNTPITADELLKHIHPEMRPMVKGLIPAMLSAPDVRVHVVNVGASRLRADPMARSLFA